MAEDRTKGVFADPEHALGTMLRDPRFYTDGVVPPVLFVTVNAVAGLGWAAASAGVWAIGIAAYRLVRRDNAVHALSGIAGLAVALVLALRTGDAANYFLPSVIVGAVLGAGLLIGAAFGRPASVVIARALEGKPPEWYRRARVRRAHLIVTLAWAALFAGRAAFRYVLIVQDRTAELAAQAVVFGLPLTAALAAASWAFLRWRLRDEPQPVGDPPAETSGG